MVLRTSAVNSKALEVIGKGGIKMSGIINIRPLQRSVFFLKSPFIVIFLLVVQLGVSTTKLNESQKYFFVIS